MISLLVGGLVSCGTISFIEGNSGGGSSNWVEVDSPKNNCFSSFKRELSTRDRVNK